jgi:chloramphenicol-sensitive protein RarD
VGYFCAITAQIIWGFFPYFYSFLKSIDSFQLVAHRCLWGFLFISMGLAYFGLVRGADKRPVREFFYAISHRRTLKLLALAAFLSGINWIGFVWAVTHGRALEASLGYYICPQVHVLLGVLILRERLNGMQWLAIVFATFGVLYISSFCTQIPWVSLLLATSFGLYGLVKKKVPIGVVPNLVIETGMMLPPAILFLAYYRISTGESLVASPWWLNLLLVLSGLLTITPLALYGTAVRHIPLSTVGLLQFIGPTLQFFCSIYLLGESFDQNRLVGFIFVWIALAIFLLANRRYGKQLI